jgi:hypothetical protein
MKLSNYENPISGKTNNIFDLSSLWAQVLGVVMLVVIFLFGQKIADYFFPPAPATATTPATKSMRIF